MSKPIKSNAVCLWCGRIYAQHATSRPEGSAIPKTPCLLLKAGFIERKDDKPSGVKVTPMFDDDTEAAKLLQDFLNHEWQRYHGVVTAITKLKFFIEHAYGIKTDMKLWNPILEEVIKISVNDVMEKKG